MGRPRSLSTPNGFDFAPRFARRLCPQFQCLSRSLRSRPLGLAPHLSHIPRTFWRRLGNAKTSEGSPFSVAIDPSRLPLPVHSIDRGAGGTASCLPQIRPVTGRIGALGILCTLRARDRECRG